MSLGPGDLPAVQVLVVSAREENAEAINSVLRNHGVPSRCSRLPNATDVDQRLRAGGWSVAVVFADEGAELLGEVLRIRDQVDPDLPVVSCRESVQGDLLSADVIAGASDLVCLSHRRRLLKVLERELRGARMARSLREAVATAASYRSQLRTFMAGSTDAIAHVQEGIILETNPAWTHLFGYDDEAALLGTPIMDLFAPESQASLKGALVACGQGRWPGDLLKCGGLDRAGKKLQVELNLEAAEFEQEPCVRISITSGSRDDAKLLDELREAVNRDASTGLFSRRYFLQRVDDALSEPLRGGLRALAVVRPDEFKRIVATIGPIASEEVLRGLADALREVSQHGDISGRLGGTGFAVLLGRGTTRDLKAWGEGLCKRLAAQLFEHGGKSVSLTCTVGLTTARGREETVDDLLAHALEACARGRAQGGDQVVLSSSDQATTAVEEQDRLWVPRIKQALMENRFRLALQPIASLAGGEQGYTDILVRMIDEQGDEVLPGRFMAAAERNHLAKNIDRWVIDAAMAWCRDNPGRRAFLRLSPPSVQDEDLAEWLGDKLRETGLPAASLVFQVPEDIAAQHLKHTRDLAEAIKRKGAGFALEHAGISARTAQILSHVPMDFLKVDGSLMQNLGLDPQLQVRVGELVKRARERHVQTIAERVESANVMAVLWQLGVHYVQGYQVREPEVVLESGELD